MTKAIILASGMGTRLLPLTIDRPKCMVQLQGMPLLAHQVSAFRLAGVDNIHVVGGYMADKIDRRNIKLHLNRDFASTNMVFSLFQAAEELGGEEDVVVSYGDIVFESHVLDRLLECDAPVCVVSDRQWLRYWSARFSNPLEDAETFRADDWGHIISLGQTPITPEEVQGQFVGLLKFRKDMLTPLRSVWSSLGRTLGSGARNKIYTTDFLQYLIDSGWELQAVSIENGWAEIDSPADLAVAEDFFQPGA